MPEPIFETKWGGIAVIFTKKENYKPWIEKDLEKDLLSKNEKIILALIKNNKNITVKELAKTVAINERNIRKNMNKLKQKKYIERIGSDRKGYWNIIKKTNS